MSLRLTNLCTIYPVSADYESVEKKARKLGIEYSYTNGETVKTLWKSPLDFEGSMDAREMFQICGEANYCVTLDHGKLYTCFVAAFVHHFITYFNQPLKYAANNGIDIYQAKSSQEIFSFLASPIPMCRHCKVKERTYNNPWGLSEKKITEWS